MFSLVAGAVGWPEVALALIAGAPGIIAAIASLRTRREIKTPSGAAIGKQVEDLQHIALANHYRIRRLDGTTESPSTWEGNLTAERGTRDPGKR